MWLLENMPLDPSGTCAPSTRYPIGLIPVQIHRAGIKPLLLLPLLHHSHLR